MKKVMGIIGVVFFVATLFFNMNSINDKSDNNLAGLMSLSSANAEVTVTVNGESTVICETSTSSCRYELGGIVFTVSNEMGVDNTIGKTYRA